MMKCVLLHESGGCLNKCIFSNRICLRCSSENNKVISCRTYVDKFKCMIGLLISITVQEICLHRLVIDQKNGVNRREMEYEY